MARGACWSVQSSGPAFPLTIAPKLTKNFKTQENNDLWVSYSQANKIYRHDNSVFGMDVL